MTLTMTTDEPINHLQDDPAHARKRWGMLPMHVVDSLPDAQTRALLLHLAGLADQQGVAWQSHGRMAAALGISPATLYRWQARLEATGHAVRIGGGHKGRIVRWAVTCVQTAAAAGVMRARMAARMRARRLFRARDALALTGREARLEQSWWQRYGMRQSLSPVRAVTPMDEHQNQRAGHVARKSMSRADQLDLLEAPDAFTAAVQARMREMGYTT